MFVIFILLDNGRILYISVEWSEVKFTSGSNYDLKKFGCQLLFIAES